MDELGEKGYQKCILDDWGGALIIWDEAIRRYPKEKRFYNNRALCHFHRKEYMRALADARFMTSQFPEYIRGHFREGEILGAMGRYEQAYECFRRIIKLDPSCTEAVRELAEIQIQMLCRKGYSRYQAGCAINIAQDLEEAESILQVGAVPAQDLDFYFSDEEEIEPTIPSYDLREDPKNPMKCCSIWVGNWTEKMTDAQVSNLFKRFGAVKSASLRLQTFNAFVNFVHHDSASEAMKALQGTDFAGNKKVIIRWPNKDLYGK